MERNSPARAKEIIDDLGKRASRSEMKMVRERETVRVDMKCGAAY